MGRRSMSVTWSGVFPALMTEFNKDGSLDLDGTQRHIKSCMDAGIEGLVMLGTLGENASLRAEEKETVLEAAVEATEGKIPVLSGVAEYTTELGLEHAARAKRAGCEGLMVLPSMVYQQDQREGQAHFNAIANGANLPVMIYNNPVSYKLDMTPESFEEMSVNNNIVAVKESSNDSRRMTDMINACGDRYAMFCGVDDLVLENLMFGATGWVSGLVNSFPKEAVALYTDYYANDPFTHVSKQEIALKQVINSNNCFLHLHLHEGTLLITSVIDNLIKGASGQAIQNMNLIFGWEEGLGLNLKASTF